MNATTKRKRRAQLAEAIESSSEPSAWPTDVPITDCYVDIRRACDESDGESVWGFYETPRPIYRVSSAKPQDSRWVLLRPGT